MAHLIYSALPNPRRPIVFVHPDVSVRQCIDMMCAQDIGALVVTDDFSLIGIVTERDIVRNCLQSGLDPQKTKAAEIAYANVTLLNINDPVEKAMEVITQTKRRHVLITEKDELIAILSIGDLLVHLLDDKTRMIEHLEHYIHS